MTENLRAIVHTPAETGRATVERVQLMAKNRHRAMPFFVDGMAQYFADLMPGEICGIIAQTSNFKTGSMNIWEHTLADYLARSGRQNEAIFHIDVENTVETLGMQEVARYSGHSVADLSRGNVRDWKKVIQAADKIAGIEIYRIADKLGREETPDMHLSNIFRGLDLAVKGKLVEAELKPAAIFIDYLQALPLDPEVKRSSTDIEKQRRLQVREDTFRIRKMANYFECPVIVGIQAKQHLSGNAGQNMMLPGVYDGEETSSIGQRFDRLLSLWMPKMTHTVGDWLEHGNIRFEVDEETLWMKVLKQRGGLPSGRAWRCRIDYQKGTINS